MPGHYGSDKKGGKKAAAKGGGKGRMNPAMMKRMEMMKKKGKK